MDILTLILIIFLVTASFVVGMLIGHMVGAERGAIQLFNRIVTEGLKIDSPFTEPASPDPGPGKPN